MRRLVRILVNVGTAASLGLCVAAAGVWGRSYFVGDAVNVPVVARDHPSGRATWAIPARMWVAETGRGWLTLRRGYAEYGLLSDGAGQAWRYLARPLPTTGDPSSHYRAGTRPVGAPGIVYATHGNAAYGFRGLVLHLAYPTALFALAPTLWSVGFVRRRRRMKRARGGLCAGCGYDLRASPARCPECGRVADAPGTS